MLSVNAIYENGQITLLEKIPSVKRAKVIITILEEDKQTQQDTDISLTKQTETSDINQFAGSISSFVAITDPVQWQNQLRSEWETNLTRDEASRRHATGRTSVHQT